MYRWGPDMPWSLLRNPISTVENQSRASPETVLLVDAIQGAKLSHFSRRQEKPLHISPVA